MAREARGQIRPNAPKIEDSDHKSVSTTLPNVNPRRERQSNFTPNRKLPQNLNFPYIFSHLSYHFPPLKKTRGLPPSRPGDSVRWVTKRADQVGSGEAPKLPFVLPRALDQIPVRRRRKNTRASRSSRPARSPSNSAAGPPRTPPPPRRRFGARARCRAAARDPSSPPAAPAQTPETPRAPCPHARSAQTAAGTTFPGGLAFVGVVSNCFVWTLCHTSGI